MAVIMKITKESLISVGSGLNLPREKLEALWEGLENFQIKQDSSPFSRVLLYFGAMVTISAMTWFMGMGWLIFGGGGIFFIAAAYALLFYIAGAYFWNKKNMRTPSGLFITMAVCMVPLAIYGLQVYFNVLADSDKYRDFYFLDSGRWVWMEIGTIIAGAAALCFYPFPFITAPVVVAGWFLSIDGVRLLADKDSYITVSQWVTTVFGLLLIGIGLAVDGRKKEDYSFWFYLFGAFALWCGLGSLFWGKSEPVKVMYAIICLLMMCFSLLVGRSVFMVFGALGIFAYLGDLSYSLFNDSVMFPFVLSCIGLLIIFMGILFQKNYAKIETAVRSILPDAVRNYFDRLR